MHLKNKRIGLAPSISTAQRVSALVLVKIYLPERNQMSAI